MNKGDKIIIKEEFKDIYAQLGLDPEGEHVVTAVESLGIFVESYKRMILFGDFIKVD